MRQKMKQKMKQLMGILLSIVMVWGLMPGMGLTAYADDPYASIKNTTTVITFDSKDWYLIDYDSSTVTLLAKECVAASQYNSNGRFVDYSSNPTVKSAVDTYYNSISESGKTAVDGNGMFLLTKDQANAITNADVRKCPQFTGTSYNGWWLCSQGISGLYGDRVAFVSGDNGNVDDSGDDVDLTFGVRPALKLNLSSVIFSSESNTFSTESSSVGVTGVSLVPSTAQTIDVDETVSFTASIAPENATDQTVKWSVGGTDAGAVKLYSNEACTTEVGTEATSTLTVYAKGISAGSATVTCTSNADSTKSASCEVTVNGASDDPYASIKNTTTVVHFDGKDWYLIDYDDSTVTLLTKECVAASQYNSNGNFVDYSSNPTVKSAVDTYYNSISESGKTAVDGNGMFLLTKDQANAITNADVRKCPQFTGTGYNGWWLCSQGDSGLYGDCAAFVNGDNGNIGASGDYVDLTFGVRPALKLNLSSVIFSSESNTFLLRQTITAEDVATSYGDTDKKVTATTSGNGAITYAVKDGSTDYIDVNASTGALTIKKVPADGKAYVIVTAVETSTYAQATKEVTVTINKANAVAATVTANSHTYDGTEKPLVIVTGDTTGGTMLYALGTDATTAPVDNLYTTSIPTATNAGTYYVWYKVVGDGNHNDTEAQVITVTIAEKEDDPENPDKPQPEQPVIPETPDQPEIPLTPSVNKVVKINDVDVSVNVITTYPKAVNWTGSKITKAQLAVLVKDGEITKVQISGLENAITGLNKDADFSKLIKTSYVIGKKKNVGDKGSFYVKLTLNSKVCKQAKIKGKDKKALINLIKELNKELKSAPYEFYIVPIDLSDTNTVESVSIKAGFKNGELQLNEDGSIKKLKSLKIKVKIPGKKKVKTYTFSGKKITKSFTLKLTEGNKAEITALDGQNFKGSRKGVDVVK